MFFSFFPEARGSSNLCPSAAQIQLPFGVCLLKIPRHLSDRSGFRVYSNKMLDTAVPSAAIIMKIGYFFVVRLFIDAHGRFAREFKHCRATTLNVSNSFFLGFLVEKTRSLSELPPPVEPFQLPWLRQAKKNTTRDFALSSATRRNGRSYSRVKDVSSACP